MNCKSTLARMSQYQAQELPEAVCRRLEEHLAQCPRCRETFQLAAAASRELRLFARAQPAPAVSLAPPHLGRLRRPRLAWRWSLVAAGAALLALVALGLQQAAPPPAPTAVRSAPRAALAPAVTATPPSTKAAAAPPPRQAPAGDREELFRSRPAPRALARPQIATPAPPPSVEGSTATPAGRNEPPAAPASPAQASAPPVPAGYGGMPPPAAGPPPGRANAAPEPVPTAPAPSSVGGALRAAPPGPSTPAPPALDQARPGPIAVIKEVAPALEWRADYSSRAAKTVSPLLKAEALRVDPGPPPVVTVLVTSREPGEYAITTADAGLIVTPGNPPGEYLLTIPPAAVSPLHLTVTDRRSSARSDYRLYLPPSQAKRKGNLPLPAGTVDALALLAERERSVVLAPDVDAPLAVGHPRQVAVWLQVAGWRLDRRPGVCNATPPALK